MKKILLVLMAVSLIACTASADFIEDLQKLASENAENYVSPFVTAFGTDMNAGLYHTAKVHKMFGFDVGIRVMGATIPDDAKTYMFSIPETVSLTVSGYGDTELPTSELFPGASLEAPTVFGGEGHEITPDIDRLEELLNDSLGIPVGTLPDSTLDNLANAATFPVPPGLDLDIAPLIMPQFSIGLPMKTELMLRWMPTYSSEDFGDINFLGIGIKHMVSKHIPLCPVDISLQYAWQKLEVGDILESTHTCFNVHASRKFSLILMSITPYVGLGMESSNLKVDYTIEGTGNPLLDGTPVSFDIDGDNGFRGRVGFSTRILLFKIYADYAFIGDYPGYSAGIMLSFF